MAFEYIYGGVEAARVRARCRSVARLSAVTPPTHRPSPPPSPPPSPSPSRPPPSPPTSPPRRSSRRGAGCGAWDLRVMGERAAHGRGECTASDLAIERRSLAVRGARPDTAADGATDVAVTAKLEARRWVRGVGSAGHGRTRSSWANRMHSLRPRNRAGGASRRTHARRAGRLAETAIQESRCLLALVKSEPLEWFRLKERRGLDSSGSCIGPNRGLRAMKTVFWGRGGSWASEPSEAKSSHAWSEAERVPHERATSRGLTPGFRNKHHSVNWRACRFGE